MTHLVSSLRELEDSSSLDEMNGQFISIIGLHACLGAMSEFSRVNKFPLGWLRTNLLFAPYTSSVTD